jgi:hypothetical protein
MDIIANVISAPQTLITIMFNPSKTLTPKKSISSLEPTKKRHSLIYKILISKSTLNIAK